ncbi:hypothetical protein MtrunA17_Chr2g0289571 [Medicago truncatula]|uniref:Uncharacterized protein n=1 Tax=Medicago truncatula TaxID=3880 RepID=A0A396J7P1_MEDTR|nr:hypothetical protein MtrunA17_Chr2g0289571 [Medicago truncatula]
MLNRNKPILIKIILDEFQEICIMMKPRDVLHHQLYHMNRVEETHKLSITCLPT